MEFTGFPPAALDFYDDLEVDNSKTFWAAHQEVYRQAVRGPMESLAAALAPEFGEAKVFRPYRDVRFARDKAPYKTHQGAYVSCAPATGWYVEVSARGVRTAGGCYGPGAPALARIREAIAEERSGGELEALVSHLVDRGWQREGDRLKTAPRGYRTDHPRIELLRHRSLVLLRHHGFEPVVHTPDLLAVVRDDWRSVRPLVDWFAERAGG